MSAVAGRPSGAAEREARRLTAADLFEQGVRQAEVARLLRVSRQAVSQWRGGGRGAGVDGAVVGAHVSECRVGGRAGGALGARGAGVRLGGPAVDPGAGGTGDRGALRGAFHGAGGWYLLDRLGRSWQVPVTRATQRRRGGDYRMAHPDVVGVKNPIHAGQAACWYSCMMALSRSLLRMLSWSNWTVSVIGWGSARSGAAGFRARCGRCSL